MRCSVPVALLREASQARSTTTGLFNHLTTRPKGDCHARQSTDHRIGK